MRRVVLLASLVLLALTETGLAQSSPSIFTSSSADFSKVRRVALYPFTTDQTVQDPFAATKATDLLGAALVRHGASLVNLVEMVRKMQEDSGHTFSTPPTTEDQQLFNSLVFKYLDAVILGRVSAWGVISVTGTRVVPLPVYGWGTGSGTGTVYGPGGSGTVSGSWSSSWQSTQYVQVRVTREASVIGATTALIRLHEDGAVGLLWQYSHVNVDHGGPFVWNRPPSPDKLAERYFDALAKAWPVR